MPTQFSVPLETKSIDNLDRRSTSWALNQASRMKHPRLGLGWLVIVSFVCWALCGACGFGPPDLGMGRDDHLIRVDASLRRRAALEVADHDGGL